MELNYEIDVQIDESALDVECLRQADLASKYRKYWVSCSSKVLKTEEYVKLVRSELIMKLMADPVSNLKEGVKPTGPVIEAFYRTHKRHIKAKEEWMEAKNNLDVADIAIKEICITRKNQLANLIELHGQHYFAGPSVPRDLSFETARKEKRKEDQKESNKGIARKMKRKKK